MELFLLVFKSEGKIPEEKDWLNRIASCRPVVQLICLDLAFIVVMLTTAHVRLFLYSRKAL